MSITTCFAPRHGARYAYSRPERCNCPAAVNRRDYHRRAAPRVYVPGRRSNLASPRKGLDEMAVERAVAGDRDLLLSVPERRAAIDRLDARGLTAGEIARQLGITWRTVQRRRAARRAATNRQEIAA